MTCQNVTMAQFAEMLPNIAPGVICRPMSWTQRTGGRLRFYVQLQSPGRGPAGAGGDGRRIGSVGACRDGYAIRSDEQSELLGLKLETVKRPVQVLVIDKIERKPIEN